MSKVRVPIPKATADSVLVSCQHTCCICKGFATEIHHIDENPANNDEGNLLPVCGNCHTRVHTNYPRAARARGITQDQQRQYKIEWVAKCEHNNNSTIVAEMDALKETISVLTGRIEKLEQERE